MLINYSHTMFLSCDAIFFSVTSPSSKSTHHGAATYVLTVIVGGIIFSCLETSPIFLIMWHFSFWPNRPQLFEHLRSNHCYLASKIPKASFTLSHVCTWLISPWLIHTPVRRCPASLHSPLLLFLSWCAHFTQKIQTFTVLRGAEPVFISWIDANNHCNCTWLQVLEQIKVPLADIWQLH